VRASFPGSNQPELRLIAAILQKRQWFDGAGQQYLSKPFLPEAFLQRVQKILAAE
jgi:CheY-like chemotaxis protein